MKDYRTIKVWQRSHLITLELYRHTKRFLNISLGSACELDDFILLAGELGYIDSASSKKLASEILEIRRMLGGFNQKLKA